MAKCTIQKDQTPGAGPSKPRTAPKRKAGGSKAKKTVKTEEGAEVHEVVSDDEQVWSFSAVILTVY